MDKKELLRKEIRLIIDAKNLKEKFDLIFKDTALGDIDKVDNEQTLTNILLWTFQQPLDPNVEDIRYTSMVSFPKKDITDNVAYAFEKWKELNPKADDETKLKQEAKFNQDIFNYVGGQHMLVDLLRRMGAVTIHIDSNTAQALHCEISKTNNEIIKLYFQKIGKELDAYQIHHQAIITLYEHVTENKELKDITLKGNGIKHIIKFKRIYAIPDSKFLETFDNEKQKQEYLDAIKETPATWNIIYEINQDGDTKYMNTFQINKPQIEGFKEFLVIYKKIKENQDKLVEEVKNQLKNEKEKK